LSKSSK